MELLWLMIAILDGECEFFRERFEDTKSETDCKITTFIFDSNLLSFLSKYGTLIMVIGTANKVPVEEY